MITPLEELLTDALGDGHPDAGWSPDAHAAWSKVAAGASPDHPAVSASGPFDFRFDPPRPRARSTARVPRRLIAVAAGVAAVASGVAVGVHLAHHDPGQHLVSVSPLPSTPSPTPAPVRRAAVPVAGPDGELPGIGTGAAVPGSFIAFTPGGAEVPTLVNTSTSRTIRLLGPGTQEISELSADHQVLYIPVASSGFGCSQRWQAVTIATGATVPAPALDGVQTFSFSPDGSSYASVVAADGCGHAGEGRQESLVIRDAVNGAEKIKQALPAGNWGVESWSPGGGTILIHDLAVNQQLQLFDARTVQAMAIVPALPDGCQAGSATLRSDNDVVLAETCTVGAKHRVDLVDIDPVRGVELRRIPLATGDFGTVNNGIGLDASRQNAIFSISHAVSRVGDEVWIVAGNTPHKQGMTGVYGTLW